MQQRVAAHAGPSDPGAWHDTCARPGGSPSERVSSGGASEGPRPAELL